MASVLHVGIGLLAGRLATGRRKPAALIGFAALSMLPDADVIAFHFGIAYGDPFGHRGATHSLAFAVLVGLVVGLVALARKAPALRLTLAATLTVATHPLLDALTDGGLGVALCWPFSDVRHFAPWRPIPVAPIGWGMLSPRGMHVLAVEALPSLLLAVLATRPTRAGRSAPPPSVDRGGARCRVGTQDRGRTLVVRPVSKGHIATPMLVFFATPGRRRCVACRR